MPTNLLRIAICLAMTVATLAMSGQNSELVNRSYDPQSDSVFFVKTHQYFEKIRQTEHRPTVAVVLAGGGARGTAHIGVLRYLEEKGIPIDFVAGTSMGGLMGGLYAMGYSVDEIDQLIRNIDWDVMMSDNIPMEYYTYDQKRYKSTYILDFPFDKEKFSKSLPSGIKYGLNIYNLMSSMTVGYQGDLDFMYLPTPFCCVASEIVTQTEKHWTSGSLITALRSTMSIPGYFRPVRADSMILADGGTKNNFPVDVAKAAGADIIIGVELYMPRDYSKVNTIADVLMQTTQYSGSLEAHNRNVKNSTVYITPDLSGYTSLSFSTEDINKMIQIGYDATVVHEREIDSLVHIVGSGGRKVQNAKALDISKTKVKISAVEYNGISDKEMRYFKDKIHITPGKYYDKEDIELEQATIYGTMAFSLVTYELLGEPDGTSYRLVFNCEKKPTNALGIGVRADSEEWIAILLNAGFGRNKIYGSVFDVTARLSIAPYLKLDWHYTPIVGPMFGASLKSQYRSLNGAYSFTLDMFSDDINENDDESYQYYEKTWRNILDIYVADTHWSRINLRAGFRFEQTPYVNSFTALGHYKGWHWTPIYPYLYLQFAYDNLSDRYFPNTGVRVTASYDYNFKNAHFAAASVQGAIPVCSFFHIIPALRNRFVFGLDGNEYMGNYVGGVMEGRYFDQQMPFIGFNGVTICNDFLTVVDVDFRFKIIKNLYLSLVAAAMHDGFLQENHLTGGSALRMNKHAIYAAGLKVAYKTKFGPLQANMHWNSKDKKSVGFYVSAGYDF